MVDELDVREPGEETTKTPVVKDNIDIEYGSSMRKYFNSWSEPLEEMIEKCGEGEEEEKETLLEELHYAGEANKNLWPLRETDINVHPKDVSLGLSALVGRMSELYDAKRNFSPAESAYEDTRELFMQSSEKVFGPIDDMSSAQLVMKTKKRYEDSEHGWIENIAEAVPNIIQLREIENDPSEMERIVGRNIIRNVGAALKSSMQGEGVYVKEFSDVDEESKIEYSKIVETVYWMETVKDRAQQSTE